ncbi:Crp/Fnr family transcriptional regulator [Flavobacterium sp. MAH-1]|uniref:Crp/Fnr family transcriptional regulator n=1 Tax=Flavobacterium agri TaxID=2743471 RepID=A0A7Y8Y204_9FLAO|nr:Crp/Fnr family transcriptional regulator [Flavobacterium agri]NUY81069.1 Crp/Fnr family transcriptional regulator [Flavobacterium agri]NYA71093.1 Crp/Fnr family transcriptional regulator [Flavobacterium agri]
MLHIFHDYLHAKFPITEQEFALIEQVAIQRRLRKRQYLLQEGDVWKYDAFVCKGLMRTYRVDDKGQEHIIQFCPENWWTGDRQSYVTGEPARYNIEAYEDSEVILIPKADFREIRMKIPALNNFIFDLLERSFIALQNRVNSNIMHTAEEKYAQFLKTYPDMSNRVPLHMIASFLGITPETLSRVRSHQLKK